MTGRRSDVDGLLRDGATEGVWKRERETTMSDYDRSIHSNPDAAAWAAFFAKTFPAGSTVPDEGTMLGWFANAMMAMHDAGAVRRPLLSEARGIAARCWCRPETSGIVMDVRLAEAFAQVLAFGEESPPPPADRQEPTEEPTEELPEEIEQAILAYGNEKFLLGKSDTYQAIDVAADRVREARAVLKSAILAALKARRGT